jgi:hypothetical protein
MMPMTDTKSTRRPAARRAVALKATILAAAALMTLAWACHSPVVPTGGEADITVTSHWDVTVNVFMDGVFRFPLTYKNSAELDNVTVATHHMEAQDASTGVVVASTDLAVTDRSEYTWTIEHKARINIQSILPYTLHIYMDGVYQFDIADSENRWIIDVPLGDHFLMATRVSDGNEACSTTMHVTENQDYGWGINPGTAIGF